MSRRALYSLVALAIPLITGRARTQPPSSSPSPSPSAVTVLRDVTIIDGTGAAPRAHQDLVISGGRIQSLGVHGTVSIPAGAREVDGGGRFIIPGLIDAHVHLATYEREPRMHDALLRAALLGGVTTVRDMGGNVEVLAGIARRVASDTVAASRVVYSAVLSGPRSMWFTDARSTYAAGRYAVGQSPGVRAVPENAPVSAILRDARGTGAQGIKLYGDLSPTLLQALVAAARRQGLQPWAHLSIEPSLPSQVLASGVSVVSHANMFVSEVAPFPAPGDSAAARRRIQSYRTLTPTEPRMQRLLQQMRTGGVALDATLHIMDPAIRAEPNGFVADHHHDAEDDASAALDFSVQMTRAAHRAGVPVLVGTDDIGRGTPNVHHELQLLVDRVGLTPLQAIQAATGGAARALGLSDSLGTVAVGQVADLVLLRDDPSRDIANTLTVTHVLRGGTVHPRRTPLATLPYLRAPRAR